MLTGTEFEKQVAATLDALCAHSRLSQVLLFRPDLPEYRHYGFLIDHLIHIRDGYEDRLLIIECKLPKIAVQGQAWNVTYESGKKKNVIEQLRNQSVSLLRHLDGQYSGMSLSIIACVVSPHPPPESTEMRDANERVAFRIFDERSFVEFVKSQAKLVQRVEQSRILTDLRKGLALPELGRPDIANAIAFVKDCRRALDHELFRNFPLHERMSWRSQAAINGTAGMGKSVMLAYVMFVLSCDYCVQADNLSGERRLVPLGGRANDLGLPEHRLRSIVAFGMSQKQVSVLQALWRNFVREFGSLEAGHLLHFHQPTFKQWNGAIPDDCNVLIVDEAHDLPLAAQRIIAKWKAEADEEESQKRYLLVACDRHQRLRLGGRGANIIDGLGGDGFKSHTLRMRRNYRSPFPVYAASLALMFRWFAKDGPKVIPLRDELEGSFGFKVAPRADKEPWFLSDINDSHPGNNWRYTVSRFLSPQDALRQIQQLRRDDVLWVRFCKEDEFFDYEQLASFTYHPMDGDGSADLIDKYIKGQEFNVVVIEGLPANALVKSFSSVLSDGPDELESQMWQARRELYLCASRANVFLFFILKSESEGEDEIENLLSQLRSPSKPDAREWEIYFREGSPTRRPSAIDRFNEVPAIEVAPPTSASIITLSLPRRPTFASLVEALKLAKGLDDRGSLEQAVEAIVPLGLSGIRPSMILPLDRIGEIEDQLGLRIDVEEGDTPEAPVDPLLSRDADFRAESTLGRGITVSDAASVIGAPVQRLLDALPVNYQANTALKPSDISRLAALVERKPEPARIGPVKDGATASSQVWCSAIAERLSERMRQPDFVMETKMVRKYVMFLGEIAKILPDGEGVLLNYKPRHRIYFARTKDEIVKRHPYASVYRLTSDGLYAMCTLSNESKITVLRQILAKSGIQPQERRALLGGF